MPRGILTDLTGQTFTRLTVIERGANAHRAAQWWCRCACGVYVLVPSRELTREDGKNTKSCGCWRRERFEDVRNCEAAVAGREAYMRTPEHIAQVTEMGQKNLTHGHSTDPDLGRGHHSPTYNTWVNMRARCDNPKTTGYCYYGGRGIEVCSRWEVFANFLEDMGERPEPASEWSINRIDSDGHYTPDNCEWATWDRQVESRRPWGSGWHDKVAPLIE